MAHLNQGYLHAHAVYGSAIASIPQQKADIENEQQKQAFTKAIKSIQSTLENANEYYSTFVIKEILKVGSAYALLRSDIAKWSRLKNRGKANAKNKELGIYVTVLQETAMYSTLAKLLSPTMAHTKSIAAAAAKTLAIIAFRPNKYRNADWYNKKQKTIALHKLSINGSVYTVLLLLSHILADKQHSLSSDSLYLRCYSLQLISNLVNHNSDVIISMNKQFSFISTILKVLNNEDLFFITLKRDNKLNKIALLTLINGLNAILNMIQHNELNRMQFCELFGWKFICKCLNHECIEIRKLSLCFIQNVCISSKLSAKYFLNTSFNGIQSFKILLNLVHSICSSFKSMDDSMDDLLCKLIGSLCSLCADNMIGYTQFYNYKSWKTIGILLITIDKSTYSVSNTLHLQIFGLLSCFSVPKSFEKWKERQWNLMFCLNEIEIIDRKKLSMKQRKLQAKKDEIIQQNEYKKTQRICREIIKMIGGYIDSDQETEDGDEYDRDIILRYLFESLCKPQFVIGAICALGKLCKIKHNGNIIRLDQIIEILKKENINKYKLSLKGLKDKMNQKFTKCQLSNNHDLNELIYFVDAANDIFQVIINDEHKVNAKHIRQIFINCNVIYALCMLITQPNNKYFLIPQKYIKKQKQIKNLKLNTCYALANVIKYDKNMQTLFAQWIPRIYSQLKNLAMDHNDNQQLQIALINVIQSGSFKPINNQNIKQLKSINMKHFLNQLHKQIQITNTIRK